MREARLAPLEAPYEDAVAEQLARFMPAGVPPLGLFRTLAHNPRALKKFFASSRSCAPATAAAPSTSGGCT
jgi:hypothetical protein